MPGAAVLVERVKRGEVETAAEPPVSHRLAIAGDKKADIGVAGWQIRIARVDDQRQAERTEGATGEVRALFAGNSGQVRAMHHRDIHPALLNHRAVFQHHRRAVAAETAVRAVALPAVAMEGLAVFGGECGGNTLLQIAEKAGECVDGFILNVHGNLPYKVVIHNLTAKPINNNPTNAIPNAARAREWAKKRINRPPANASTFR